MKTSELGHTFIVCSAGIVHHSKNKPIILSICKNCRAKSVHLTNEGQWYEIKNNKYTKDEFFKLTCEEFIIKELVE